MIFSCLDLSFDVFALQRDFRSLMKRYPLSDDHRQLCLTHRPGSQDPLWEGIGRSLVNDAEFSQFNDEFRGTIFETIYKKLPYRLGRVRLLFMPPRTCYSLHRDTEPRIHVAIRTDPQARLLVEDDAERFWNVHVPVDGRAYWIDTTRPHTAINGSTSARVHLVANIVGGE